MFLSAVTSLLGKVIGGSSRAAASAGMRGADRAVRGHVDDGRAARIAQQATLLSNTIKAQIVKGKAILEEHGFDTSFMDLSTTPTTAETAAAQATPRSSAERRRPASGGGAIFSQTLKLLLGAVSAVGNFFIVIFLGVCFAAQPAVYRNGPLRCVPRSLRATTAEIADDAGDALYWLRRR
ncbi:MAG: hypothetical protein MZV49_26275 [Rhodopseudomonas palustris]|nr:hypothetical protein [Rhodopseudomonas palustris]